jgi:hypothetical protein
MRIRAEQGEGTFDFFCRAYTEFLKSPFSVVYLTFAGRTMRLTRSEVLEKGKFLKPKLLQKANFGVEDFAPLIQLGLDDPSLFANELEKLVNPSIDAMTLFNLIEKELKKKHEAPVT